VGGVVLGNNVDRFVAVLTTYLAESSANSPEPACEFVGPFFRGK
jgi:hypothetical protein